MIFNYRNICTDAVLKNHRFVKDKFSEPILTQVTTVKQRC